MTKISAKVIADSKNELGNRITTMEVIFPRFILAELNTHRMMSRNSASSRAIPFEKMLKMVKETPFIPIAWQKDHKGIQGTEYRSDETGVHTHNWLAARDNAVASAEFMAANEVTKQLCNRLLEPFMFHKVLITATEWENFFALRCPKYQLTLTGIIYRSRKDCIKGENLKGRNEGNELEWLTYNRGQAEIHMMELAEQMWDAMNESTPKELKAGEWHIPFGDGIDNKDAGKVLDITCPMQPQSVGWRTSAIQDIKIKIATARCARVSYTVVGEEGKPANYENDIKLHDRLAESGHWSPFEHCAYAMSEDYKDTPDIWSGNFKGFVQYRKRFNNENITK